MSNKVDYVTCSRCGKKVSNKLGKEPVVRAWVECPECLTGQTGEQFDLEVKKHKIMRWGNYQFHFSMAEDDVLIETAFKSSIPVEFIPSIPVLRPGIIMTDEDGIDWEVTYAEMCPLPPCRIKGVNRFETPEGYYSPTGWIIFRYKIIKLEK